MLTKLCRAWVPYAASTVPALVPRISHESSDEHLTQRHQPRAARIDVTGKEGRQVIVALGSPIRHSAPSRVFEHLSEMPARSAIFLLAKIVKNSGGIE
jgi:hypothetical protein